MEDIKIIYKNNKPYGIRDWRGFLFFFSNIYKYPGQEDRYRTEIEERFRLADFLKEQLDSFESYGGSHENTKLDTQ